MNLKEFIQTNEINKARMSRKCGISLTTLLNCYKGMRPNQKTAESIEAFTKGAVTVLELRGIDERKNSPMELIDGAERFFK